MRCPNCKMSFVLHDDEDCAEHEKYHDLIVNGSQIILPDKESLVWCDALDGVVLITDNSPPNIRKLGDDVATCSRFNSEFDGLVFRSSDPPDERDAHIFIYVKDGRGVGLLCLDRRTMVRTCSWDADSVKYTCDDGSDLRLMWSIGYVWVHEKYRKNGLASRFLNIILRSMDVSIDEIGWYSPFSNDGEKFIRKLCPTRFFIAK